MPQKLEETHLLLCRMSLRLYITLQNPILIAYTHLSNYILISYKNPQNIFKDFSNSELNASRIKIISNKLCFS